MRPSKAAIRATYERIAESFALTRVRPWPEVIEFVDGLPRDSRVLDLGCGNGRHAKMIAAQGHRVVGVDFSRRLLSIGRQESMLDSQAGRIEWLESDAGMLPLRDGSFDAATCIAVLHHLPQPKDRIALLTEVRRVLRSEGHVLFSVWSKEQPRFESLGEASDVEVPWTLSDGSAVLRFYHLFADGELERLIIESGLHGERFFRGAGNWFARARRDG